MNDAILVLNAGSSSLKFSAFRAGRGGSLLARGQVDSIGGVPRYQLRGSAGQLIEDRTITNTVPCGHEQALRFIMEQRLHWLGNTNVVAVGHRVVHGGTNYGEPVAVSPDVLVELERLVPLAPLHQPHNLLPIRTLNEIMPQLPQVACFDTAFHRTQPEVAQQFALPRRYMDEGIRRYGFHGLSFEYIASILPGIAPRAATGRTVIAHLGNGASLCALFGGRSSATTMGFTPADGLVMGTRSGLLDPGVLIYLMRRHGMDAAALEHLIYYESGLLGVSGLSNDMRCLLASTDPKAAEAVNLFVYRIVRELGSMAAALGGIDAIVFTGGIGENSPAIRARVCQDAAWLGVDLDGAANKTGEPRISHENSRVTAWVLPTNEESVIAEHTRNVLGIT